MRTITIYLFCFLNLVFLSCTNNKSNKLLFENIETIENIDTLITQVRYVPLKGIGDEYLGSIDRIVYRGGKIYVLDVLVSQKIMVFDSNGFFLYQINRKGKGPGEYLSITDFDVDSNGNVYVFDNGSLKLIKYSNNAKEHQVIELSYGFIEFRLIDNERIVAYNCYSMSDYLERSLYGIYNISTKEFEPIFDFREDVDMLMNYYEFSHLFKSEAGIYFYPRFSDAIYCYKNELDTFIHFDESLIPKSYNEIERLTTNRIEFISNKNYLLSIAGIFETSNGILLNYKKGMSKYLYIQKDNEKKYVINSLPGDKIIENGKLLGASNEYFIYVIDNINTHEIKSSLLNEVVKGSIQIEDDRDDPLIVFFKLK